MRLELDNEAYWRMSPQESYRWLLAKSPQLQIGGLGKDDIEKMAANIRNNEDKYI
tara:strand:+ start:1118 stop:1282 length:165 start_codon:yes stop_codon:yes gene_type:complete